MGFAAGGRGEGGRMIFLRVRPRVKTRVALGRRLKDRQLLNPKNNGLAGQERGERPYHP